jgi:hypothetical protein
MRVKPLWLVLCLTCVVAVFSSLLGSDGVINDPDKLWQVRYNKIQPNYTNDLALRLRIFPGPTPGLLTARLERYDRVAPGAVPVYVMRVPPGALAMKGRIKYKGDAKRRLLETFELEGMYTDAAGMPRRVTIEGFHHPGRERKPSHDDVLAIRLRDRGPNDGEDRKTEGVNGWIPQDIDILVEVENTPPPPEYDADSP